MAGGLTLSFDVTGVAPFLARLHEITDPRKLERTTRSSLGRSAQKVIAPRLAGVRGWRYGGHGGANPTKGLMGERRRITARRIRTRPGEYVAISVKPRGWAGTVEAWVVKGTRPHLIRARAAGDAGVDSRARSLNRSGGAVALRIAGRFANIVEHPGAQPTDYIRTAAMGTERLVMDALAADLFRQMDKAARGRK